ncbi:MAG: SDR family NAD(P)-dependent oxidoreductase [Candidatus Sericytochromatia bacterium]
MTTTMEPVAVVGVSAVMPDAPDAKTFWDNIKCGRYSISDVPTERWDPELYYDPDPHAPDKTYSRIGGWVRDFVWEPLKWKLPIPPAVSTQMDVGQQWAVACTRAALLDAGWPDWAVDPERVAVIIGNAIGGDKQQRSNLRIQFPAFTRDLAAAPSFAALPADVRDAVLAETRASFLSHYEEITEDTMPGELANVLAGRVANLFNFRGPNFTADAACASALAAMSAAVHGLQAGDFDAVITGGVDRNMDAAGFVKFCKIGALSATGTRPFDAGADGFVMGEGAALFVLKRLSDAERDGDRIYTVLLGIAGASDGRGKGITAPNPVGQRLAVERAWQVAGVDPRLAGCIEAHGTSTRVGDATELASLTDVFRKAGAPNGSIALGSVKSNIGHLKGAAGTAGLFKTVMSLHDKVLAPSLHFEHPNESVDWDDIPFKVNTELREWPAHEDGVRYAGVSAFGFGGTNFHAVLEEYVPGQHRSEQAPRSFASAAVRQQASAPGLKPPLRGAAVVGGADDSEVTSKLEQLAADASAGRVPPIAPPDPALAHAVVRVAIDYADAAELATKAGKAVQALNAGNPAMWKILRAQGVFVGRGAPGKVAFLYTGQGSQYVNMLAQLRQREPVVAATFNEADKVMAPLLGKPLTEYIFADDSDEATAQRLAKQLMQTEITQPAVLTTDLALTRMLGEYGVRPDMVMGHSLGEYGALVAAGALSFEAALEAVSARGREMANLSVGDNGAMAAVFGPLAEIERVVAETDGYVVVANINSTGQAVIGGATDAVDRAVAAFQAANMNASRIAVSHAFHTEIVAPVSKPLKEVLRRLDVRPPQLPIVANVTGDFYPADADVGTMLDLLGRQVASPVRFVDGLRSLYAAGARVFVEVGPKKALHGFVEDVLGDDVLALFTNHPKQGDVVAFNQALCGLYAAGLGYSEEAPQKPLPTTEVVMTDAQYAELGRHLVDVVQHGVHPGPAAPATTEPVVITGAALGLPGVERVFDDDNITRILDGQQFIDSIPHKLRREMLDRHITRLVKRESGDPTFETIDSEDEVIKLAGRAAPLDVVSEFGVDTARDAALDTTTRLAIGAGFDALRDAGIPLVMHYKTTTLGTKLPDRWGLPESMRDDTGVIFASAFPGLDNFAKDLQRYYTDRSHREQLAALEAVRGRISDDEPAAAEVDRRIHELRHTIETDPFVFDRRFLFRCLAMGHSQFAEIIGARGPNTAVNAACASTTQAAALAEDWIRAGRCRRVVVVSADDASSDALLPWLASGFLASGAAATDDLVEDAAMPFDQRRHGMILGMGAAAFVVESADSARERGLAPICEVLGAVTANSAFHGTRLDVEHIGAVMEKLLEQAEARGVDRHAIAASTVFVSHETYTPARGGSASAEIHALRRVFGSDADSVVITNTKGFTGHAMGAGVEDVVAIKALETGVVPPVPNYKVPDPELGHLNLSKGGSYPVRYALRLGAGFGSQIAMTLMRWTPVPDGRHRMPDELGYQYRIVDPATWRRWLAQAAGTDDPQLEVVQHRLRIVDTGVPTRPAPVATETVLVGPASAPVASTTAAPPPTEPAAAPEPVASAPAGDEITDTVVGIVSGLTGYSPDLLDVDLDLEADLGVDTVKQAEIFAAIREHYGVARDENLKLRDFPTLSHVVAWIREKAGIASPATKAATAAPAAPPPMAAPAPQAAPEREAPTPTPVAAAGDELVETVLRIVTELTGYPPELLDVDLDLEADLGVDTVKQAEIFAAIREHYGVPRDDTLKLRDFPTLTHVIAWIRAKTGTPPPAAAPADAPAAAAAAVPVPAEAPAADEDVKDDDVRGVVVGIVSELTGYPPDLLDVDLDLEADLGVDTVKQAEIFAAIRGHYGVARDDTLKLRDFPTLTHVIGWIRDRIEASPNPKALRDTAVDAPAAVTSTVRGDLAATDRIPRRVPLPALRPDLAACAPTGVTLGSGTRVAVMRDHGGIGDALTTRLRRLGVDVVEVHPYDDVAAVLADAAVDGVYWLTALDDEGRLDDMDLADWREALHRRVRNLYLAMRTLYERRPFLVVATRLGGYHGYDTAGATCPLGGAVTGFAKAYKREQPETLVKAVDFPASRKTSALAEILIDETLRDPGCVEVGYADGRRWGVGLAERPFPQAGENVVPGDPVFVVTGAAGSIVAAITADLAAAYRGTFHLLDLTPEPDPADPDLRRYTEDRDGLKTEIADRLRQGGQRPTPVLIERELARLERLQAALAAIQAVERVGGTAYYHSVDLTDADAVSKALNQVQRVDLLVHAAGVEVSHTLPDKEPREFDLVLGVKADGLFNVLRALGEIPLGTVVAFSSVAGRFGNVGQTDYSAANDLQAKVLSGLHRTRPDVRTLTIDWTAWGGIGMATRGSIPKIMAAAGVDMLPAEAGVAWIRHELNTGVPDREVVVAGALGALAAEFSGTGGVDPSALAADGPMLDQVARMSVHDGLVVHSMLDPAQRPFLDHHRIDGTAVLPGVMGIEAFAEAARVLAPDWHVAAVENVDFRAPLKFYRDEPRTITVTALLHPDGDDLVADCRLSAERKIPGTDEPQRTVHFTGSVRLTADPPSLDTNSAAAEGHSILVPEQVYRLYFHGPAYQVVGSAWKDDDGAAARFAEDLPPQVDGPVLTGPRLVELCFQAVGLLEAGTDGHLALPLHVGAVRLNGQPTEQDGLVATVRRDGSGGFDCVVHDVDGNTVVRLDAYRTIALPDPPAEDVIAPIRTVMGG